MIRSLLTPVTIEDLDNWFYQVDLLLFEESIGCKGDLIGQDEDWAVIRARMVIVMKWPVEAGCLLTLG